MRKLLQSVVKIRLRVDSDGQLQQGGRHAVDGDHTTSRIKGGHPILQTVDDGPQPFDAALEKVDLPGELRDGGHFFQGVLLAFLGELDGNGRVAPDHREHQVVAEGKGTCGRRGGG